MRTFYIFRIKQEFKTLFKDNPKGLFLSFYRIYHMNKDEIDFGYNLIKQLTNSLEKEQLDRFLFVKLHNKMFYTKQGEDHVINNLYKDEVSILRVKNFYIKLEVNKDSSMFFDILYNYYEDYFVCDFENLDYFFLKDVKILV